MTDIDNYFNTDMISNAFNRTPDETMVIIFLLSLFITKICQYLENVKEIDWHSIQKVW